MPPARKPWWQQATALVSLGAGGTITGFSFAPGTAASIASPASLPVHLTALEKAAQPAAADDAMLRSAIVNVTNYYLQMAKTKSPAEMEAIIWQRDSADGVDHGESCAAFASMTLELAAQVVGQQSWVTGGGSYPWPLHQWADVRVDPNPASLGITSVLQDAQAHGRWHPLGDGYQAQPGDWVLFDGHIEVVTSYTSGVLRTVGGDSLPNFSVNAHEFGDPLSAQGVAGFVNNGTLAGSATAASATREPAPAASAPQAQRQAGAATGSSGGSTATGSSQQAAASPGEDAAIPGVPAPTSGPGGNGHPSGGHTTRRPASASAARKLPAQNTAAHRANTAAPGTAAQSANTAAPGTAAQSAAVIPGVPTASPAQPGPPKQAPSPEQAAATPAPSASPPGRHQSSSPSTPVPGTSPQQAFINAVAPGAAAAQRKYGVPAAVTIAQAINESGWGQSQLATKDNNLFGIKGTGPAGSDPLPTQEYLNGQWVSQTAAFRVYNSVAESIDDHGKLLATSGYYGQAMASRGDADAFANALTGIYATDPGYGQTLIGLMSQYNLYRYGSTPAASPGTTAPHATPAGSARTAPATATAPATTPASAPETAPAASPPGTVPADIPGIATPQATPAATPQTAPTTAPQATPSQTAHSDPTPTPATTTPATARPATAPPAASAAVPRHAAAPAARTPGTQRRASRSVPSGGTFSRVRPVAAPPTRPTAATPRRAPAAAPSATAPATTPASTPSAAPTPTPVGTPSAAPTPTTPRGTAASSPASSATTAPGPAGGPAARGSAAIPGVPNAPAPSGSAAPSGAASSASPDQDNLSDVRRPMRQSTASTQTVSARLMSMTTRNPPRRNASHNGRVRTAHYKHHIPQPVMNAFVTTARVPLIRAEPLYRDVASDSGIRWELLAACDWMQCKAHHRYSPVQGEKLRTVNADGTVYRTRSEALAQCANDLAEFSAAVYQIDLTADEALSVRDLANVFAAFRWGALLRLHHTSALEFPYSVAGLTAQHMNMRWPDIDEPNAPDKPGARFRQPFGAVPIVLGLGYPATV
jgi:flagellum-specific peptidoglycan hydrolase FlgJ